MDIDKSIGMFLGLAIGDALGAPLEFKEASPPDQFLKKFTISKYIIIIYL